MDEINDFFDFSKPLKRVENPHHGAYASSSSAMPIIVNSEVKVKRERQVQKYDNTLKRRQETLMNELNTEMDDDDMPSCSKFNNTLNDISDDENNDVDVKPQTDDIYDKYHFLTEHNNRLPIHDNKEVIITMIRKHPVVILEGETGCGKTTQVPQYILDDAYTRREFCSIACTQPRRIAALSIARRVSSERNLELGSVVGYQIALHQTTSADTRLLFCTTGVLLQKIITAKSLCAFTHILLDEVHERDQEMDFLLIVIRHHLATTSKHVKIVMMSATIDTSKFAEYFKIRNVATPVVRVDTRRLYSVKEYYLDDLARINITHVEPEEGKPNISLEMYSITLKLLAVINNIENDAAMYSLEPVTEQSSILIFLPGLNEIDQMLVRIERLKLQIAEAKLMPIRLHSLISHEEQNKIFLSVPGYRKVILATNIAESSITVPDVKYVIDFCLTKNMVVDSSTNFSSLKMQWASKANCKQRAGRAGRLSNGRVYRMVSKYFYMNYLHEYSDPEMLRCPLETVVLKAKLLELGPPTDVLSLAMDPPELLDVTNTILTLKEIGALYTHVNGQYKAQDGDLTFIGRIMAGLPIDVHLSRLVVLGYMFSVLEDTIIMAAGLSVRSIFKYPVRQNDKEAESHIRKLIWADASGSDLFAIYRAYKCWVGNREQHSVMEEGESRWANRYYIDLRSLKEMHLLVQEIKDRLEGLGIREQSTYQRIIWFDREKTIILKVVIAGAFYPNYFIHSKVNDLDHDRGVNHILNGNDALSTVYFTKFDSFRIGQIYMRSIKELFKVVNISPSNIQIRFQPGSERVFVTFVDNEGEENNGDHFSVPGIIRPEIFKALLIRSMKLNCTIPVIDSKHEAKYVEQRKAGVMKCGQWVPAKTNVLNPDLVVLPTIFVENLRGYITHVASCSKFFFQPLSEMERLREIGLILNDSDESKTIERFECPANISMGMHLSAPFEGQNQRAKVLSAISSTRRHVQFKVLFIDYGTEKVVEFENLCPFPYRYASVLSIPPRAFECRLAHVQPSELKSNNNGFWEQEANDLLKEIANSGITNIKIFSLVDKIANVEIYTDNGGFHEFLVHKELARKSEESYMSKMDHDARLRKQAVSRCLSEDDIAKENSEYLHSIQSELDVDVEPPPPDICTKTVTLKGPFSPLEIKVFSATKAGAWKSVLMERDSINNILLDTDPYDLHERLVVAASVSESQNGDTLTARCTSIMPNIHGFSALMTLLFCPRVQIKCNKQRTKFVSILAGLGFDEETQEPLYEEHDIVLNLDVDLLPADIELINQIRYCMDSIVYTDPDDTKLSVSVKNREDLSAKIKNLLIRLLNKNRDYIETQKNVGDSDWQKFDNGDLLSVNDVYGHRTIFPMHSILNLCAEKFESMHALGLHCKELYDKSNFGGYITPITCRLCNQIMENITQLRLHLLSQLHRDREKQINFKMH